MPPTARRWPGIHRQSNSGNDALGERRSNETTSLLGPRAVEIHRSREPDYSNEIGCFQPCAANLRAPLSVEIVQTQAV